MINNEHNIEDPRAGDDIPSKEALHDPNPRRDDPDPRHETAPPAAPIASPVAAPPPDAMLLLLEGVCNLIRQIK